MGHLLFVAAVWVLLAVVSLVSAILANHMQMAIALVEICVEVVTGAAAAEVST